MPLAFRGRLEFQKIISAYLAFLNVDELTENFHRMAARDQGVVKPTHVCESRRGENFEAVMAGNWRKSNPSLDTVTMVAEKFDNTVRILSEE
jgi:hypothetical protein